MGIVIHDLEILVRVFVDRGRLPVDDETRQGPRFALELLPDLIQMVPINVAIPAGPYEFPRLQVALFGEHVRQDRIGRDIERQAQKTVHAPLVELAG